MTREELLALVNKELGSTKLTLNERAINEELDDSLGDFGEDEAANTKLVTRIANRLKRMDGSVHSAVSREVKEYKKKLEESNREKGDDDPKKGTREHEEESSDMPEWARQMMSEWKEQKEELQKEKADRKKKDLLTSVRKGLEDKFKSSGLKLNSYFANAAMSKLDIPEKDADVKALVDEAERLYTSETKSAGIDFGKPAGGGTESVQPKKEDGHEFDDVAKRMNPNRDSGK
jgi:hypothetical protein